MTYIETGDEQTHRLSFYLAMEEYIARHLLHQDDCFFMWQVDPSVIFGRNQVPQNEVNIEYCIEHGIQTYRRKSGGGCVYADQSNVMLSYITPDANVTDTFSGQCHLPAAWQHHRPWHSALRYRYGTYDARHYPLTAEARPSWRRECTSTHLPA